MDRVEPAAGPGLEAEPPDVGPEQDLTGVAEPVERVATEDGDRS